MDVLRRATRADAEAILALRLANRPYIEPTEPDRDGRPDRYHLESLVDWVEGTEHPFVILDDGEVAGTLGLFGIAGIPARSAMIGYFVDNARNGRGLASRAVAEAADLAFGELGLHRLEAGTRTDNIASQRVLERNRFTRVGVLRRHLKIGGTWVDHLLWERLEDD